jgi:hypothetical protein
MKNGHKVTFDRLNRHSTRDNELPSQETLNRRAQKIEACLRHFQVQVSHSLAGKAEAEWIFGRLFILHLLNQSQYDAALRIDMVVRNYRYLLAPHGRIKAWRPEALRQSGEDLSPAAQKRMLEARRSYEEMYGVLRRCGDRVVSTIFTMLETDSLGDLSHVLQGLNAMLMGK